MKILILFIAWCVLLAVCWPLAIAALVLTPIVWVLSLPFVLFGIAVAAFFALVRGIFMLPARLLGIKH